MANQLPQILSDNELRDLRHSDDAMERTSMVRSGTRMAWEATKGAAVGGTIGTGAGIALMVGATLVAGPVGTFVAAGAPVVLGALGAAGGAAINAGWGILAKGSHVRRDEEALQKAAILGAQQNGQLTPEQAQGLAPTRSVLKGTIASLVKGAALGIAVGAAVVGVGAVAALGAPLAIAAGSGAAVYAAYNMVRNSRDNKQMETTIEKAASLGGMKARSAALQNAVQQQRTQEQAPGKFNDLGHLSSPDTPMQANAMNAQTKGKRTRA